MSTRRGNQNEGHQVENINLKDSSGKNQGLNWNYLVIIKWVTLGLIISLGSVFLIDLLSSGFSKYKNSNNNNNNNINNNKVSILEAEHELQDWLKENELLQYSEEFRKIGVVTLVSVVQLDHLTNEVGLKSTEGSGDGSGEESTLGVNNPLTINLAQQDKERLKRAAIILRQRLILRLWLDDHSLLEYAAKFNTLGVNSIEDAYWFEDVRRLEETIGKKIVPMWTVARQSLPSGLAALESLKSRLWNRIVSLDHQSIWNTWGTMLLVTLSVTGFGAVASYFPQVIDAKQAILQYVSGKFSLANNCQVEFDWEDPVQVGQTVSFTVKFFHRGGRPYPICNTDNILIEVKKDSQKVALVTEFGSEKDPNDANLLVVKFSVRKSGQYLINLMVDNSHVKGSPFTKTFLPSQIDSQKTLFLKQTSTVVCITGLMHKLSVEPRDCYGNRTGDFSLDKFGFNVDQIDENMGSLKNCSVQFSLESKSSSSTGSSTTTTTNTGGLGGTKTMLTSPSSIAKVLKAGNKIRNNELSSVSLQVRFPTDSAGVFHGLLTYEKKPVQNGKFEIVVLNSNESAAVQKNVAAKSSNTYYEGKLLAVGHESQISKARKVYISVNSKQLVVKEYLWKLLPMRIATFRLSPNTKLQFVTSNNELGHIPTILIDDGSQPSIKVAVKDAKTIVATFTHFLLRNIGGSETFQDKQEHFFKELRDIHRKHPRDKLTVKIARENIIESTWKATKGLSTNDWCRNFEISFIGEQGIDWGGLRREWFEQVCSRLFEGNNPVGLFSSLGDSRLVHPNPNSRWKPKHYEMAGRIVGKSLFESSLGSAYRQMVKARFTRSFLAQLIGLRVSYKYFESDDPELYLRKIKFILENDVEGMELTFSEEEYDPMGKLSKTVDLIPDGSKITVTNENKREYLNALAQYRLAAHVKPQVDAFLKGLNDVVPDELLSIFDENELELLMCGTSEYSVTELREHHVVVSGGGEFRKILDWFWTAVANMTEEEKARLLQFTTGCSQLPPGGFRELSPLFQLTPAPTFGNLPTAHTCFNQLCLPDYENYEQFEKSLRIAINEGSEGFGLI